MVLKLTSSETKLTQAQAEKLSLAEERIADNENPFPPRRRNLWSRCSRCFNEQCGIIDPDKLSGEVTMPQLQ